MSKGQWTFRPAALKRAIKAAQEAGLMCPGSGLIHRAKSTLRPQVQDSASDLDRWLAITARGK